MFGGFSNLAGILKSAKDLQGNLAKMQETLASRRYEATTGGDMVRATVDGRGALVDLHIDPRAASDVELLEDLIKAAVGAAAAKSQEGMKKELAALTGGLNIPGLEQMLGG
jgi:DNA-binding YbaB/EbfC family protein